MSFIGYKLVQNTEMHLVFAVFREAYRSISVKEDLKSKLVIHNYSL